MVVITIYDDAYVMSDVELLNDSIIEFYCIGHKRKYTMLISSIVKIITF